MRGHNLPVNTGSDLRIHKWKSPPPHPPGDVNLFVVSFANCEPHASVFCKLSEFSNRVLHSHNNQRKPCFRNGRASILSDELGIGFIYTAQFEKMGCQAIGS
jgi:hypothetical protein